MRSPAGAGFVHASVDLSVVEAIQRLHARGVHEILLGLPLILLLVEVIQPLHHLCVRAHLGSMPVLPGVDPGMHRAVPEIDFWLLDVVCLVLYQVACFRPPTEATHVWNVRLRAKLNGTIFLPLLSLVLHAVHLSCVPTHGLDIGRGAEIGESVMRRVLARPRAALLDGHVVDAAAAVVHGHLKHLGCDGSLDNDPGQNSETGSLSPASQA
mmetsp:Transcript_72372/g.116696  ORF Transcript_72372/g.116696 Transcript_72372/m.116696 type:complete len:211 (+) Transcript_72372:1343-1975(+)